MNQVMIKQKGFTTDYNSETLPPLFKRQSSDCNFAASDVLDIIDVDLLLPIIESSRQTILIACNELKSKELIHAVMQKADAGIRVYLLLGDTKNNQAAIDTLSGRCLIRTDVKQQGALVLVDHTTTMSSGLLLMGQNTLAGLEGTDWVISLEHQQLDDCYRSFCKLFWEESGAEYLQQNSRQKQVDHPDGQIITNHSHHLCGTLHDCLGEALSSLAGVSNYSFDSDNQAFKLLLNTNFPSIEKRSRFGVSLTEAKIPTLLLADSESWLLPNTPDFDVANWCLKLSPRQSSQLVTTYNQAVSDAAWQYAEKVSLSELAGNQELRFADKPDDIQSVDTHRECSLEAIYTKSIDSFLNDDAQALASEQTKWQRNILSHQVSYTVDIHPPYCPSQAMKDSLYDAWQDAEKNWQDQLSSLIHKQKSIDTSQASISDRLKGFVKSFLLGQGQAVKKLNAEISELQKWSITQATPAEREDYKQRLNTLQTQVMQRGRDTALKLDEAEQNNQWNEQREKLQKKLEEAEKSLLENKGKLDSVIGKKSGQETAAANAFTDLWKKSAGQMTDEQLENVQLKREDIETMDVPSAEEWKNTFKPKNWKKHYINFEKALSNHQLALNKIKRGIDEANKSVTNAEGVIEHAKKSLADHGLKFEYKPKLENKAFELQLGLKEIVLNEVSFTWPQEDLPHIDSELRCVKKQRFLVIFDLENLERYRADAERLNAEIVCDKGLDNA